MKSINLTTAVVVVWLAISGPGLAAPPQAAPPQAGPAPLPSADEVPPEALALTKRYFAAIHFQATMGSMLDRLTPMLVAQQVDGASLSDQQKALLADVVKESVVAVEPLIEDKIALVCAQIFTLQELREMVAFYEGPTGQSITSKTPQMMAFMPRIMAEIVPQVETEVHTRLCRKIDCAADKSPKKSKS